MHTFYVLMKIYQISEDDPLIYQSKYSQQQLDQIFSGEHSRTWNKNSQKEISGLKLTQKEEVQR